WDDSMLGPQQWTVPDLIPTKEVCLFSGTGGGGKSTIALHLCAAHALGLNWLNWGPVQGPSIFIDCEDHIDVVRRRLTAVIQLYDKRFADLQAGGLHLLSRHGNPDNLFATADRSGKLVPTTFYQQVLADAARIKPVQIVLASSANIYAGSEIDRSQVTQFVGMLLQLAVASGGSVILISHPSLAGMANSSGISGSTGWHNTVRSRMYLEGVKAKQGGLNNGDPAEEAEEIDSDLRRLKFLKNQYGPAAAEVVLRWRSGMFLPPSVPTDFEKAARTVQAEPVLMTGLRRIMAAGGNLSGDLSAKNYAPRVIAKEPEASAAKVTLKDLKAALVSMLASGKIKVVTFGSPSHRRSRIEPA
ncbi:MAG TPA: AAA family ATPase, partial [Hyphomicrobiaceae bacterium]|nr:AAA family ATPase [Hyphomicrobiaceae bacterium]